MSNGHVIKFPSDCEDCRINPEFHCPVCVMGLDVCLNCGQYEAGLDKPCSFRPVKLIIAGGRDFNDYSAIEEQMRRYHHSGLKVDGQNMCIFSGGAKGADTLGAKFGDKYGLDVIEFLAHWGDLNVAGASVKRNKYGYYNARAGFDRNLRMAKKATHLLAFYDGFSKGTAHMIEAASDFQLNVAVVRY